MLTLSTVNDDKYNLTGMNIMYYEEKEVNGIVCFRSSPSGKWIPLSTEMIQQKKIRRIMSDAVDMEQELIRLKDESRQIQIDYYKLMKVNIELDKKAKAWDDLEALVNICREKEYSLYVDEMSQTPNQITIDTGHSNKAFYSCDLKESVSNALESMRGE